MNNFIVKAKDMYWRDSKRFDYFADVFETIEKMSICKNYFQADLFNIEEVLSILEMEQSSIAEEKDRKRFVRFISEVIKFYTPPLNPTSRKSSSDYWHQNFLDSAEDDMPSYWLSYLRFASGLFGLSYYANGDILGLKLPRTDQTEAFYSIITLNYDLILENAAHYLNQSFYSPVEIAFEKDFKGKFERKPGVVPLAKLHGCASSDEIVAPTWNKGVTKSMIPSWDAAFNLLSEANQIRVIGYSLPTSDAYLKYLLKAAVVKAPHLKALDVICLDGDGSTFQRYREFITFKYARFKNADSQSYLYGITQNPIVKEGRLPNQGVVTFSQIESKHAYFMSD